MPFICFVILISAVMLKLMVKITSIFGSPYWFLRIAWHDIFLLSQHLIPASWNFYIPHVAESKSKYFLMPGKVKGSLNPIPNLTIVLIWKTPACLKFGKTSNNCAIEKLSHWMSSCYYLSHSWCSAFCSKMAQGTLVKSGAVHSG